MNLYAFYHKGNQVFMFPFSAVDDADAAATFHGIHELKDGKDYQLFKIGYFAPASGAVEPLPEPVEIVIEEDK